MPHVEKKYGGTIAESHAFNPMFNFMFQFIFLLRNEKPT